MNLPTPVNKHVFVEFNPRIERKTASGLSVPPPKHEGVPNRGKVLALPGNALAIGLGDGNIEVGDTVFFVHNAPQGFVFDDINVLPIELDMIVGVLKGAE